MENFIYYCKIAIEIAEDFILFLSLYFVFHYRKELLNIERGN